MAKLDKGKPKGKGKPRAAGPASSSKGKQRQRDEAEQVADPVEEAAAPPSIDLDKVAKKMHHALRQVHSAAKRSKQFEIQRLIKRSKAGPSSSSSSTDPAPPIAESIEGQMHEIKCMDLNALAAIALLNKLAKAKLLPKGEAAEPFKTDEALKEKTGVEEWPLLHGVWEDETLGLAWTSTRVSQSAPAEDTAAKARAKLLSNKVLAEETAKAVEALGKLVATKPQGQTSATDGAQAAASTSKEQAKSKGETSSLPKAKPAETAKEPDREWSGSEDEEDDDVQDEEAAGASDGESDDESDEEDEGLDEEAIQERVAQLGDLDQWDHLIGGSGSDEGEDGEDDEGGSSDEEEDKPRAAAASGASDAKKRKRSASPQEQRKGKKKVAVAAPAPAKASSPDSDGSDDDDDDDDSSASDAESSASSSSSSSRYLPTLSHGFVTQSLRTRDDDFSGSEDEGDYDFEEDVEDHLPKGKGTKASNGAAKKNRMGQRARKALWEKKYGRNANHVKLREKEKSKGAERQGAFKPLRRGRDGKVVEEFVEPERKDSGWKRFPVKDEEQKAAPAASSSRTLPARGGHHGVAPPARPPRQQQRPPPPAHRPRGPAPSSAASDAAAMHPSWVAKQKQKEKEEAIARSLAGGGRGAGKKVVFD